MTIQICPSTGFVCQCSGCFTDGHGVLHCVQQYGVRSWPAGVMEFTIPAIPVSVPVQNPNWYDNTYRWPEADVVLKIEHEDRRKLATTLEDYITNGLLIDGIRLPAMNSEELRRKITRLVTAFFGVE